MAAGDPRTYADLITRKGLREIATYADGIGPSKNLIVPRDQDNSLKKPTSLVRRAHESGLIVHAFTFRNENFFLPSDYQRGDPKSPFFLQAYGDAAAEYRLFYRLGVDGVFSDNPDTAVAVREKVFGL